MSRLEALDIAAGYGDVAILKAVDLVIPDGQVTILIGPNGCGKSTLLNHGTHSRADAGPCAARRQGHPQPQHPLGRRAPSPPPMAHSTFRWRRSASWRSMTVALPLYELGAPVVGSAGRTDADGNFFMRGGVDTLGIDYSNTDIEYVGGFSALDVEAIAALQPDLIIGGTYTDAAVVEQLQSIAPALVIDNGALGLIKTLETLADVSGKAGDFETRYARYLDNVERTKAYIGDTSEISATMTFMFPAGEELWVYGTGLGAISQLLSDLGFAQPEAVAALAENQASWSAELIQDLDADFIFGFYRQQPDATPEAVFDAYEKFAPGWRQALTACQNGQMILLPGPTFGSTMTGLELALELVETHIAGRAFTPFEE